MNQSGGSTDWAPQRGPFKGIMTLTHKNEFLCMNKKLQLKSDIDIWERLSSGLTFCMALLMKSGYAWP